MGEAWKRWAHSFAQVAVEDPTLASDLERWREAIRSTPELGRFLARRDIPVAARREVARAVFGERRRSSRFMELIIARGLIRQFDRICDMVAMEVSRLGGKPLVRLASAQELQGAELGMIRKWLIRTLGIESFDIDCTVDGDLLGGLVVEVGSRRIDMSIRGRLKRLERELGK